jgi:hypothetical protein
VCLALVASFACTERSTGGSVDVVVDAGARAPDQGGSSINGRLDAMFGEGGGPAPVGGTAQPPVGGSTGGDEPPVGGRPDPGGDEPPLPDPDAGAGGAPPMGDPGPCATRAPDALGACPATIYEARQDIGIGNRVSVTGVVTAVRRTGDGEPRNVTLQVGTDQGDYFGPNFGGIWLFVGDATAPAGEIEALREGDRVVVTATTNDFFGQRQLMLLEAVSSLGAAAPVVPLPMDAAEIATGGARADALEASLVEIYDAEVSNPTPAAGEGDREPIREFEVTGGLRVDDFLYRIEPDTVAGELFPRLTGVLRLANNLSKLEPRSAADVERRAAPPPPPPDMGVEPPPADMGAVEPPPAGEGPLLVTEVDYDQMGTDTAEFVEIHNPGDAPVALAGVELQLVNGADAAPYRRFTLSDVADSLAAGGYLVVGAKAVVDALPAGVPGLAFNPNVVDLNNSQVQNGPDAVRLVDGAGTLLDALAYEGEVPGAGEGDFLSGDPGNERPQSASRCPVDRDTNDNATDFRYVTPSPGLASICE